VAHASVFTMLEDMLKGLEELYPSPRPIAHVIGLAHEIGGPYQLAVLVQVPSTVFTVCPVFLEPEDVDKPVAELVEEIVAIVKGHLDLVARSIVVTPR
jgi:hypothetical protein